MAFLVINTGAISIASVAPECAAAAMGGRREIRRSALPMPLGTGSEKARRGGGGGYCVWLPSTTRAASLPALQPPSRRLTSRNLLPRLRSIYADPHVHVRRLYRLVMCLFCCIRLHIDQYSRYQLLNCMV